MICLVGGKGSIGSRYQAIMKWANIPHVVYDIDTPEIDIFQYNKFIIATPTHTHCHFLRELEGATILCEKPVSFIPEEIPVFDKAYTVCNWKYVCELMGQKAPYQISYDFYRTGPDGLYWDLSQILYLDPTAVINNQSPKWNVKINGNVVAYRTIEESYVRMIKDFNEGHYENLWTLAQGKEMSEVVLERIKNELKR